MKFQHLVNSLALLSTVLVFHSMQDALSRRNRHLAQYAQAILYTALALIVMTMPIELFPGARLDTRGAFIALASLFAGPLGLTISVTACALYRFFLGGSGVWVGLVSIFLSGLAGFGLGQYLRSKNRDPSPIHFLYLGIFLGLHSLMIRFNPGPGDPSHYYENVVEVALLRIVTVFVFGMSELGEIHRQNRERKLTESHQFFEILQSIGQVGVWVASPIDNRLKLSAQVYKILGRNPETQAITDCRDVDQVIHLDDRQIMNHQMMLALSSDTLPPPVQVRLLRPDGEIRTVWSHIISLDSCESSFGRKFEKVGLFHDITEQSALYNQLAHSAKLATLGKLASMVSHEINNPLTSAILLSEKLSNELGKSNEPETGLNSKTALQWLDLSHRVSNKLQNISSLVQSIVAFARTDACARMTVIDPHSAIMESVKTFNDFQLSNHNQVPVEIDLQVESKPLYGHADRLQQVLINLLSNASDSIPAGKVDGKISVIYEIQSSGRIQISVEDNGTGMDESVQRRVLEPFFTTKPKGKGTGLGLSIASKIIEEMRGELTVHSQLGHGSRFEIQFPVAPTQFPWEQVAGKKFEAELHKQYHASFDASPEASSHAAPREVIEATVAASVGAPASLSAGAGSLAAH